MYRQICFNISSNIYYNGGMMAAKSHTTGKHAHPELPRVIGGGHPGADEQTRPYYGASPLHNPERHEGHGCLSRKRNDFYFSRVGGPGREKQKASEVPSSLANGVKGKLY